MHRRPFTTEDAYRSGHTHEYLRHAVKTGTIQRIGRGVYVRGVDPATPVERALGIVTSADAVISGTLAGIIYRLDSMALRGTVATIPTDRNSRLEGVCRSDIPIDEVVPLDGYRCTNGLRTMIDLATVLSDLQWEQALESALRKQLLDVSALTDIEGQRGAKRIRRVLALRPQGVPATESLLETLMVQLIRTESRLPTPHRQVVVVNRWNRFVARVDLAWPDHGIFLELDGQHHLDQPVYDANRQTAVVAAKAWFPGRFTWHEVTRAPKPTLWRLMEMFEQVSQLRRPA